MKKNEFDSIIVGSSPVSLIYALLNAFNNKSSLLFTGEKYGGAWGLENNLLGYRPFSTHILMHSQGLSNLLDHIKYKPKDWESLPKILNEKFESVSYFGASKSGIFLGNPSSEKNIFINYLTQLVEKFKDNIQIKKESISTLKMFSKKDLITINNNNYNCLSLISPSGSNYNLFFDNIEIKPELSKTFLNTSVQFILERKKYHLETFIRFNSLKSKFRELQISNSNNYSEFTLKVARNFSKSSMKDLINAFNNYYFNIFNTIPEILYQNKIIYYNRRNLYSPKDISKICKFYDPSFNLSQEINNAMIDAQDLSKVFQNYKNKDTLFLNI